MRSVRASRALTRLPPYPFAALEEQAAGLRTGQRLLRFAIGDPDLPPPPSLLRAALQAMRSPGGNRYSSSRGEPELREAFAGWFVRRFGVLVDPTTEVCVLVGSKEGLAALPRAILNPGDRVAVPDPGYPAYGNAVLLAGLRTAPLPLDPDRGWLPRWDRLSRGARLVYLNYPNNPTGALARRSDLAEAVERAGQGGFLIAFDNAYSEITFGPRRAPSILEIPGARDRVIEFHSLSKTLGIAGWRIGFAVGNAAAIRALTSWKSHSDSGPPKPLQHAAARLLSEFRRGRWPSVVRASIAEYGRRVRTLARGLGAAGWSVPTPEGTLYLWQPAPEGYGTGAQFARYLLNEHRILVTPGEAFGRAGRSYVRWSATAPIGAIREAVDRLT